MITDGNLIHFACEMHIQLQEDCLNICQYMGDVVAIEFDDIDALINALQQAKQIIDQQAAK